MLTGGPNAIDGDVSVKTVDWWYLYVMAFSGGTSYIRNSVYKLSCKTCGTLIYLTSLHLDCGTNRPYLIYM